jgi:hypothetical protein
VSLVILAAAIAGAGLFVGEGVRDWISAQVQATPQFNIDHYACNVYGRLDRTSPAIRQGNYGTGMGLVSDNPPGIDCWPETATNQEIIFPYGPGQQGPYLAGVPTQADLDQGAALANAYIGPAIASVNAMHCDATGCQPRQP